MTFTVTVAVSVTPPEVTVYVKVAGPLKLAVGAKSSVPSANSVTTPFVTATGVPTLAARPSMAVMACAASSNESLALTAILTVVSSLVEIVSAPMSATAATVRVTVDCTVPPKPSDTVTTKLSLPL
ncbi:hypothetical protein D3C86_345520 [compost metagenome]